MNFVVETDLLGVANVEYDVANRQLRYGIRNEQRS
jgi:hypothetical protein